VRVAVERREIFGHRRETLNRHLCLLIELDASLVVITVFTR
jgi:hypothetical protein